MNDHAAINNTELWKIIMRLADPNDLLRTILSDAPHMRPTLNQTVVLSECTVQIHLHIPPTTPPPETPPLRDS